MKTNTRAPRARYPRIISKGGKVPTSGIKKGMEPQKTELQKALDKWPPKFK